MKRAVEFRSYKLKPGAGIAFHDLIAHRSVKLMRGWGMDVVAFGQSTEDSDAYLLVRSYESVEHLRKSQEEFYATDLWRRGPREALLALIDNNVNTVVWLSSEAVEALRTSVLSSPQ